LFVSKNSLKNGCFQQNFVVLFLFRDEPYTSWNVVCWCMTSVSYWTEPYNMYTEYN
jgi:hypothetical protein